MPQYEEDKLKKYLEGSSVVEINKSLKLRLTSEFLEKYELGLYRDALENWIECIEEIKNVGIKYPANANPIFYIYVVPDNQFIELLNYPVEIATNGGGNPVKAYDLDSFFVAYGTSNNLMENRKKMSVERKINQLHELAHLVHNMFFEKEIYLKEGFTDTFALYILEYEKVYPEYIKILRTLKEEQILTARELIELGNNKKFHTPPLLPSKICSSEITYISSYLLVRGMIETIEERNHINKIQATQQFLEMMRNTRCWNEWLIFEIADFLNIPKEMLLTEKELQMKV